MFSSEVKIRVRYAETDKMGYVYYGNYATYYEVARVEALRNLGFVYADLENMGVMMPVTECTSKYIKPAVYDELLTVKITIPEVPGVKMKFTYEITNEKGQLINTGTTTLVFVDMKARSVISIPDVLLELFAPYYN